MKSASGSRCFGILFRVNNSALQLRVAGTAFRKLFRFLLAQFVHIGATDLGKILRRFRLSRSRRPRRRRPQLELIRSR